MDASFLSSVTRLTPYASPLPGDNVRVNPISPILGESERGIEEKEEKDPAPLPFNRAGKDEAKFTAEGLQALQRGPDGGSYAVGGEVGIAVGTGSTPEAKAANAARAQRAANAPANPSGADRAVAARAAAVAASARAEIREQRQAEAAENEAPRAEGPQQTETEQVLADKPVEAEPRAEKSEGIHRDLAGKPDAAPAPELDPVEPQKTESNQGQQRSQAYTNVANPIPQAADLLGELYG